MNLVFSRDSWKEYRYWQETDPQTLKRIKLLIKDTTRDPYRGSVNRSLLGTGFKAIGPAVSQASIAWFIVCPAANCG